MTPEPTPLLARRTRWVVIALALLIAGRAAALPASPTLTFTPQPDPCGGVCDGRSCYVPGGGSGGHCLAERDGCRCRYASPTPTVDPDLCVGDCDGNRAVTVDELIHGINIVLGSATVGSCLAALCPNGSLGISCLVRGVANALQGCPPLTRPTATPTLTATPVRTPPPALDTAIARLCSNYDFITLRVNEDGYEVDCQQIEHGIGATLQVFRDAAAATAALDLVRSRGSAADFHGLDAVAWIEQRAGGIVTSDYLVWTSGCWLVSTNSTTALPALPEHSALDLSEALYAAGGLFDACGAPP
jgi:hypothetical protein